MSFLNLAGNPTPPGVPVAPGRTPPAYQAIPGQTWAPPFSGLPNPTSITRHTGRPSNGNVVHSSQIKRWPDLEYDRQIMQGQPVFHKRSVDDSELVNILNIFQFNQILSDGYNVAMGMLERGEAPEGLDISIIREVVNGDIKESDIEEYIGREAALEEEIKDSVRKEKLKNAVALAKANHFVYLFAPGILHRWNFWGIVNNLGEADSLQSRRRFPVTVVNTIIAKKAKVSNIWGEKFVEIGNDVHFVLRRKRLQNGEFGCFEIFPIATPSGDPVPLNERVYTDVTGHLTNGPTIEVGCISETSMAGGSHPAPNMVVQAINSGGNTGAKTAFNAMGNLPTIWIQVRGKTR